MSSYSASAPDAARPARSAARMAQKLPERARRATSTFLNATAYPHNIHPGLVPGINVDEQKMHYRTDKVAMVITGALILGFIAWGLISTDSLSNVSDAALQWVVTNTGWLFVTLAIVVFVFMVAVGFSKFGRIPLGLDDEEPEYSFGSWVAMLFSAGMGIGLLFFGAYEPMTYFRDPAPGSNAVPESDDALMAAITQTVLHWGLGAWAFYALVGGAVAYSSYRRGRRGLMSAIFTPLFGKRLAEGGPGRVIDMMAIVATLFGTAASLGIGATQIARGLEITTGLSKIGNVGLILIIAILTCAFIASAASGVSRGIRYLSNLNMTVAMFLAVFVFFAGPTVFVLYLMPSSFANYIGELPYLMSQSAAWGADTAEFTSAWTIFYWAWWVSWAPFVGMFIAKISRGRTIRQFVIVVLGVPTAVCLVWFSIFGGGAMKLEQLGRSVFSEESEQMLFNLLGEFPLAPVTAVLAMVSIGIFFVTSADSASLVMGTLSQGGKAEPDKRLTVFWGLCLSGIAVVGLLIGGDSALQGLQNLIIVTALPFAFVIGAMMIAFWRDLSTDPMMIRRQYATKALSNAVKEGLTQHGDEFALTVAPAEEGKGAGEGFDSTAEQLTEWYQRTDEEDNPVDYDYDTGTYLDDDAEPTRS